MRSGTKNRCPGVPENVKLNEAELNMATQLIENLTREFEPEKYKNEYRDKLMELIRRKAEGDEIVTRPEAQKTNVIDLMQALQASLQQTQAKYVQENRGVTRIKQRIKRRKRKRRLPDDILY